MAELLMSELVDHFEIETLDASPSPEQVLVAVLEDGTRKKILWLGSERDG